MNYRVAVGTSSFAAGDDIPKRILEQAAVEIIPNPYARCLTEEKIISRLDGVHEQLNRTIEKLDEIGRQLGDLGNLGVVSQNMIS